jgi:hypothetical protein
MLLTWALAGAIEVVARKTAKAEKNKRFLLLVIV